MYKGDSKIGAEVTSLALQERTGSLLSLSLFVAQNADQNTPATAAKVERERGNRH